MKNNVIVVLRLEYFDVVKYDSTGPLLLTKPYAVEHVGGDMLRDGGLRRRIARFRTVQEAINAGHKFYSLILSEQATGD